MKIPGTISPFQSVCTALAATVGTGNIAGVATALTAGGPRRPVLDVGFCFYRYDHGLWGNLSGDPLPAPRTGRPLPVRPLSLYGARA